MDATELKAELLRLMKDDPDLRVAILAIVDPVRLKADLVEAVREGVGDMLDAWGADPAPAESAERTTYDSLRRQLGLPDPPVRPAWITRQPHDRAERKV
jgi:hypothetical protein